MSGYEITLTAAQDAHFDAIVALERAAGRSLVALTEGHALREARARGQETVVALVGDAVVGWIWYGRSLERGAEEIGQVYRVAVASDARRAGVARALLVHASDTLAALGCTRLRVTVDGDDAAARALFEDAGFIVDAVVMERKL
jgi:ribosomal protein S18 acetylase RimI-like enzyme